jgi:protein-S-isoprenylcysteine O-methyltransferase Ste14
MEILGKPAINPLVFYTGKISGYITWIILILQHTDNYWMVFEGELYNFQIYISYSLLGLSAFLITISLLNLGKSTRFGIPTEETKLKTKGIYSVSRNPMYLGFNLLTISAIIYTSSIFVFVLGIYSIIVYHLIIKAEESFLEQRFGNEFLIYKSKTRRYI